MPTDRRRRVPSEAGSLPFIFPDTVSMMHPCVTVASAREEWAAVLRHIPLLILDAPRGLVDSSRAACSGIHHDDRSDASFGSQRRSRAASYKQASERRTRG